MAKRKRDPIDFTEQEAQKSAKTGVKLQETAVQKLQSEDQPLSIQIITGSYERVLHGITTTLPVLSDLGENSEDVALAFQDAFLFNAHSSSLSCLAISPPSPTNPTKLLLATGSTDEHVNLYALSTVLSSKTSKLSNRNLGTLLLHSSTVTTLHFPTYSKLVSSSTDNTISITRTRDWTTLSTIKPPVPKPLGRPSGDTAPVGTSPAGVNDFAVHPSLKLMLSVGRGEKCMRLWNLVTGKKAGVLVFGRDVLKQVGEGRWGGEGRKLAWAANGEEFVVVWERGAVVYGLDSTPKSIIRPLPSTKLHSVSYISIPLLRSSSESTELLSVSTEDGRLLFYNTASTLASKTSTVPNLIPSASLVAQLGGSSTPSTTRVKAYKLIVLATSVLVITGSSDGTVRLWRVTFSELLSASTKTIEGMKEGSESKSSRKEEHTNGGVIPNEDGVGKSTKTEDVNQVGALLGTCETGNRITCLEAFVMDGVADPSQSGDDLGVDSEGDEESTGSGSSEEFV